MKKAAATFVLVLGISVAIAPTAQAWEASCTALTVVESQQSFVDNYRSECTLVQARAKRYYGAGQYSWVYGAQSSSWSKATKGTSNSISSHSARARPYTIWDDYAYPSAGTTYAVSFSVTH